MWITAMLRKFIQAGAIVVLLTGDATCQPGGTGNTPSDGMNMNVMPDTRRRLTPDEARREQEIENQYRETVNSKIPDKKATNDPWGNMRSAPAPTTSTAKPKHP
jgi:hypothetical protein